MKSKKLLRWMGLILSLSFLLSLAALPASALTPAYPITGTYRSSTYYENLLNLPRTGDKAFDTLAIALSQVGYHEGNSSADFDGENAGGNRNYTEYNHAFGQIGGTYGYAWCAAFVSWCLEEADAADAAGGLFASCTLWVEQLRALGQYSTRASGYRPKAGDLIFFRSAGAGRASDHIGLVRYVKNGRVYTVEGNSSERVALNSYALTNTYIVGYGRPKYGSSSLPSTALSCEDTVTGWYTVTNDFVNIRSGAGTAFSKVGRLNRGEMVRIVEIKNGWGLFYENGKAHYISLDYADFTSPLSLRVTYDAGGGENAPDSTHYFSMSVQTVSADQPTREGYIFLSWQDAAGNTYQAGDKLPVADVALTAVWEAIPVIEPPVAEPPAADPPIEELPPAQISPETGAENSDKTTDYLSPGDTDGSEQERTAELPMQTAEQPFGAADLATAIVVALLTVGIALAWYFYRKKQLSARE